MTEDKEQRMRAPDAKIRVRQIRDVDRELLFRWANDPLVRRMSFNSKRISWAEHCQWFEARLQDLHSLLFIAEDSRAEPVGLVRFDVAGRIATISIIISPGKRGRGFGSAVIEAGCKRMFQTRKTVEKILAYIKPENEASIRAFRRAGFQDADTTMVGDQKALRMFLARRNGDAF